MAINRRDFIAKTSLATTGLVLGASSLSASSYNRIIGANDRLNVAIIGLGRRLNGYTEPISKKSNNVRLTYLCDVMTKQRENAAKKFADLIDNKPKLENDIRKVLEDKNLDAVFNATPDHWHAAGSIMAMKEGKHVYVEKPISHNMKENELLVAAQKKYGSIVQAGTQQRSAIHTIDIIKQIHEGAIGKPYKAIAFYSNKRGRVPNQKPASIPEGLDWDLFQGPAPRRDYTEETWNYNWHWYGWNYGTGEAGNNGTHEIDVARWALGVNYPKHVAIDAIKGHYLDDGWEMYDTMEATYSYEDNKSIIWDGKSRNGYNTYGTDRGTIIYGSEGSVYVDRVIYVLRNRKGEIVKKFDSNSKEAGTALGGGGSITTLHAENFFDTIRGKSKLTAPINEAVISAALVNYANVAYRIKQGFDIDPSGVMLNNEAKKLAGRSFEKGWEITI